MVEVQEVLVIGYLVATFLLNSSRIRKGIPSDIQRILDSPQRQSFKRGKRNWLN